MSQSRIFGFDPGELMVRSDGTGVLAFFENDIDFGPYEDLRGNLMRVELPSSELIALRDFLNSRFPPEESSGDIREARG